MLTFLKTASTFLAVHYLELFDSFRRAAICGESGISLLNGKISWE
jgi:hypothetical protein